MKRILITTDFSPHSRKAIDYMVDMLRHSVTAYEILLLNTYMVSEKDPQKIISQNDELKLASRRNLEHERLELLKKITNPHIMVSNLSHMGSLPNVVSQLIKNQTIDLVVMGKDGGKNVENVSEVLKQNGCSLLVTYIAGV